MKHDRMGCRTVSERTTTELKRVGRRLLCTAALLPLFVAVHYLAFWLRFEGQLRPSELKGLAITLPWVISVKLIVFMWFRVYQGLRHYVTFHDLIVLAEAATAAALLITLGDYLLLTNVTVPRSVFLMDWCGTIVAIGGLQSLIRLAHERGRLPFVSSHDTPVFIVGANDTGEALLRTIHRNPKLPYRVIGFVAEEKETIGTRIGGVSVIGTLKDTCRLAEHYGVREVLIAAGELSGKEVRTLLEEGRSHGVAVKVLPSFEQLLGGSVAIRPRDVSIEDLLHRDPVQLNMAELHQWLDGRVLLVTGSAGSIGSEICRQLLHFSPKRLVLVDRSETGQFFLAHELNQLAEGQDIDVCLADISDAVRMEQVFQNYRPDVVFHAAAYKHVPMMEANPGEAIKNIVLATKCVADLAARYDVTSFVMISTDKAVNPTSIMGASKRVAELYVQSLSEISPCRFVTVRFGNVLDSAGSVVPIFREQIARGGPVTVTHPEMVRFFMTIPEASQLVIQAGVMGQGGEIFVLDMGEPIRIVDLAHDIIRLSGLTIHDDIEIKFCGMRPGEKMYEELHGESEKRIFTSHPKIMVAECERYNVFTVRAGIDRLGNLTEASTERIVQELIRVVPEFESARPSAPPRRLLAA